MSRSEDSGQIAPHPPQGPAAPGGAPACAVPGTADRGALSPSAMTLQQATRVLAAVGARYATVENIRRDIEAGAPVNADGTVNLVHYAAWLAKEMAARGD
ncbi:MAG TPA: hypothetical protein PLE19_22885 [Planctomycetota bacterium]|nr:hypothetical protein [Planctomycetota bacterium]HRR83221.1 hypothetical protein [Planctomycetota bacterium]